MTPTNPPVFPTRRALIGAGVIAGAVWTVSYHPTPDPAWEPVAVAAPWLPRDGPSLLIHNNRLWLFGGSAANGVVDLRDAWSSSNGIEWNRESGRLSWTPAAQAMNAVFAGRMWRMGGFVQTGEELEAIDEIWSSIDGRNWTLSEAHPGWPARGGGTLVVFGERLWLLGGTSQYRYKDNGALFNDVWSSADGVNWDNVSLQAAWVPRAFHTAAAHDGRLWVMGGGYWAKDPMLRQDVWSTRDGIDWRKHTDVADWPGRIWATAASYNGLLWILGGFVGSPRGGSNDIWYSYNGKDWFPYLARPPLWPPRLAHSTIVFNQKLWIIAGSNGDYYNDIWTLNLTAGWSGETTLKKAMRSLLRIADLFRE